MTQKHPVKKPIGSGWQYEVYDIGGGRVQKVPHGFVSQFLRIHDTYQDQVEHPWWETLKEMYTQRKHARKSQRGLDERLGETIPPKLLANPRLSNPYGYTQDKLEILYFHFEEKDLADRKKVLRDYIQHVHTTWSFGFSDTTFEVLLNCGINKNEDVVLADLGEITFNKEKVARTLREMSWVDRWSYDALKEEFNILPFLKELTQNALTVEALDRHWNTSLK